MPDPASTAGKLGSTHGIPLGIEGLIPCLGNPSSIARQVIRDRDLQATVGNTMSID